MDSRTWGENLVKRARVKVLTEKRREKEAKSFQEMLASRCDFTERKHFDSEKPLNIQISQQSTEVSTTCKTRSDDTSVVCRCSVGDISAM